jgi:predicted GNAT family acetyltransferase
MAVTFLDNVARHRVEMYVDDVLAGVEVYRLDENVITFVHTEIFDDFAGQHLGSLLATHVLDEARRRALGVIPECPYIRKFIAEHVAQYLDLVPVEHREEFDLPRSID